MTEVGEKAFAPEPLQEEPEEPKKEVNVRLLLFFDGTLNNRTNVDERLAGTEIYEQHQEVGSYNNAASNIALLERHVDHDAKVEGYDHIISIYTEGAGTEDRDRDYMLGYSLGVDKTGIDAKVQKGIEEAILKIRELVKSNRELIARLSVDFFGFSRGAASARYCVYQITPQGDFPITEGLEAERIELKQLDINFVGLFDTVSSHGLSFSNDVKTLNLDSIAQANKVVQLAAAEEYRANFSLTDIRSCEKSGGQQIFLPGAHSDVGGGYREGEENHVVHIGRPSAVRSDKQWLTKLGWYKADELEEIKLGVKAASVEVGLRANRSNVKNAYSKIPLKIMAQFCTQEGIEIKGDFSKEISLSGESQELRDLEGVLMSYAASGENSQSEDWETQAPLLKNIRNNYLHMSARYELGMNPRFKGGSRKRKVIHG